MAEKENLTSKTFNRLYEITKILISEGGCPWDKDQTPLSLRRNLIEEVFEVSDALSNQDLPHVKEELGDVLFNVFLMAALYEQNKEFTLEEIMNEISEKLVRRHPHVFKESEGLSEMKTSVKDSKSVLNQWDRIKENIEGRKGNSCLDSVPEDFPPLLKAYKYVSKAAKKGFTWKTFEEAEEKVLEELKEIKEAVLKVKDSKKNKDEIPFTKSSSNKELAEAQLNLEEEVGDAFLALVNYSRMIGVDPMLALDKANRKFKRRFSFVEKEIDFAKESEKELSLEQMVLLWKEAKKD